MSWEEYRNTAQTCRVGISNGEAQQELDLARDVTKARRASTGTLVKIKEKSKTKKADRNCALLPL